MNSGLSFLSFCRGFVIGHNSVIAMLGPKVGEDMRIIITIIYVYKCTIYCIIRGYEVIIEDIRSDDSERDTITVLKKSIYNV